MMAMRLMSSESPCTNRSAKATGIRSFTGHCGKPPKFDDCSFCS